MLGGQNYGRLCHVSSRCCMSEIIKFGHCFTELFTKLHWHSFFWDTVYYKYSKAVCIGLLYSRNMISISIQWNSEKKMSVVQQEMNILKTRANLRLLDSSYPGVSHCKLFVPALEFSLLLYRGLFARSLDFPYHFPYHIRLLIALFVNIWTAINYQFYHTS